MGKKTALHAPKLTPMLRELGENIRLARMRRNLTATMLAERAGMTRTTLSAIEKGEPTVSLGAYSNVLFSLGLEDDLLKIGRDDEFGRKLQDVGLVNQRKVSTKRGLP